MRRTLVVPVVALALTVGCGDAEPPIADENPAMIAKDVKRLAPSADAPVGPTVDGMIASGPDLIRASGERDNVVLSPLSICYAFGMTDAGARGDTRTQIHRTLGFPDAGPHEALNALTRRIGTHDVPPPEPKAERTPGEVRPPVVAIANGLFVQRDFPVEQDFLRVLAEQYGAGVRTTDFTSGGAADEVNGWVRKQTADRIEKLFDRIDPDTRLVLANAVYLKADWAFPFEKSKTKEEAFRRTAGSVRVPMMHQEANLRYAAGSGWQAVELPYADRKLAMWVIVPTGDAAPLDLLSPQTLGSVGDGLAPTRVNVALPRWDFATDIDLKKTLTKLGMTAPFDKDRADFTGIVPRTDRNLYISQAVHRANITVDENGTEAAAVTGVGMSVTSLPPPAKVEVRADHPFAFAIVHTDTRTPLFVGQVTDPTAR
jgi:serine protease inhibitor